MSGLSLPGYKRLYALSGNECAFPGCSDPVTVEENGEPVTTSEAAHIVASSRQGPRGRVEIADEMRRSVLNHVLFCDRHHKVVDAQPRVYSVAVLRKIKDDHERRVGKQPVGAPEYESVSEEIRLTALALVGLPAALYRADVIEDGFTATLRRLRRVRRSDGRTEHTPFVLQGGQVWAFHNLLRPDGPFANAVQRSSMRREPAADVWANGDWRRHYVRLLNRALQLHLEADRGLAYDREHNRFWFEAADGEPRIEQVATKTGQNRSRQVAYEQRFKDGEAKGVWCHWALHARFAQVGPSTWVLSLRPGYQWTTDGTTLLDPDRVSRRASRKMAHTYNAQYFDQVHFWQTWLTEGTPRLVLPIGEAAIIAEAQPISTGVEWPAIGDETFDPAEPVGDNLLTMLEYQDALDIDPDDLYVEEPDPEPRQADDAA